MPEHERDLLAKLPQEQLLKELRDLKFRAWGQSGLGRLAWLAEPSSVDVSEHNRGASFKLKLRILVQPTPPRNHPNPESPSHKLPSQTANPAIARRRCAPATLQRLVGLGLEHDVSLFHALLIPSSFALEKS